MSTLREEEKKKRNWAIALGTVAALLVGYQMFNLLGGDSAPPPPAAPVINTVGKPKPSGTATKLSSAALDPTLHMEAMLVTESLVYSGSGRNIFSGEVEAPPPVIPQPVAQARNTPPPAPRPPQPIGPPPLPPIPLKFFGTSVSQSGTRRAFLLNGDDVFIAAAGDIVDRRYRVVSIAENSVLVEDIPNTNKQTLPRTMP